MRPSNLSAFRELLAQLRAGAVSFDTVARALAATLYNRAERFLRRWRWSGQEILAADDLAQEMLLALWRAVDSWDPERADLVRYVDAQLGRACQRRLREVTGYPDPRRPAPARQVSVRSEGGEDPLTRLLEAEPAEPVLDAESVLDAWSRARVLVEELHGLDRRVVELVLAGHTLDVVTQVIYADVDERVAYRLDSISDARRLVGAAARRATHAARVA